MHLKTEIDHKAVCDAEVRRNFSFVPNTVNDEERTIEVVMATEHAVKRIDWQRRRWFDEILLMQPRYIRKQRLDSTLPLLRNHNGWSVDSVIGRVENYRFENARMIGKLKFGTDERSNSDWERVKSGLLRDVSIGYRVFEYEIEERGTDETPVYRAIDYELFELSLVAIPADPGAHARAITDAPPENLYSARCLFLEDSNLSGKAAGGDGTANNKPQPKYPAATGDNPKDTGRGDDASKNDAQGVSDSKQNDAKGIDDAERKRIREEARKEAREEFERDNNKAAAMEARSAAEAAAREQLEQDRKRVAGLRDLQKKYAAVFSKDELETAIREDKDPFDYGPKGIRADILDKYAKHTMEEIDTTRGVGIETPIEGLDADETIFRGMGAALRLRQNPSVTLYRDEDGEADKKVEKELRQVAREWRGFKLIDMARDFYRRKGTPGINGMNDQRVANLVADNATLSRTFRQYGEGRTIGGQRMGGHGSSDFAAILLDTMHNELRRGYTETAQTFQAWAKRTSVNDFRVHYMSLLSEMPNLLPVNERGEYQDAYLRESQESIQVFKYGRTLAFTWELLINDSLGALTNVPNQMGIMGSRLESDIVYNVLTQNPNLNTTGQPLFSAAHKNEFAAGGAPSAQLIANGIEMMAIQRGLNLDPDAVDAADREGAILSLVPRVLLHGPSNVFTVSQIFSPRLGPQTPAEDVPDYVTNLQRVMEPRIQIPTRYGDVASPNSWYLIANPQEIDTVLYCYLEGNEGMFTESRMDFRTDGMEVKFRHCFGAAAIDYRGMIRNVGP